MTTQTFTGTLVIVDCCTCAVPFGMTEAMNKARRNDHAWFYCPAGHKQHYTGHSETEQLRARLRTAERSEAFYRDQAAAARRSAAAQKGQVTRIRNLIAKGICPVSGCRRNFTNVREHMATEHPDYHNHEAATQGPALTAEPTREEV